MKRAEIRRSAAPHLPPKGDYARFPPFEVCGTARLEHELGEHPQCLRLRRADDEGRDRCLPPGLEPVANPLLRAHEADRVHELVRNRVESGALAAGEIELLDPLLV